jgi:hypothetical protein
VAGRRREQGTIRGAKPRTRDLPAQHLKLVAHDQELDVLDVEATATADEHPKQSPKREVQEGEGHTGDPPSPRPAQGATRLLAPLTPKAGHMQGIHAEQRPMTAWKPTRR